MNELQGETLEAVCVNAEYYDQSRKNFPGWAVVNGVLSIFRSESSKLGLSSAIHEENSVMPVTGSRMTAEGYLKLCLCYDEGGSSPGAH